MRIFGQPCTANASRNLLAAVGGGEEDSIDGKSLDEFRAGFCCVGQERSDRTLLLAGTAAKGAIPTVVFFPGGVLRYDFVAVAKLSSTFHEHLVSLVVLNVIPRDTHPITDSIQGFLKCARGEERETLVSPLLPNIVLRLKRRRPVYCPTASPCVSCNDIDTLIVRLVDAAIVEEMNSSFMLGHGKVLRRIIICFVDDNDAVAGFSEVLCTDAATAAAAHNHYVCFNGFRFFTWGKFDELVGIAFAGFPMYWDSGKT